MLFLLFVNFISSFLIIFGTKNKQKENGGKYGITKRNPRHLQRVATEYLFYLL